MFVVEITYQAPLPAIDAAMKRHVAYLERHYADGTFVMSGRQVPRTGGIILAIGDDRAHVEAIVGADPFVAEGLATARIVEFRASQLAADLPDRLAAPRASRPARRGA